MRVEPVRNRPHRRDSTRGRHGTAPAAIRASLEIPAEDLSA